MNKKSDKSGKKNSQLVLRLDKDERDAFVDLCKKLDTSAARESSPAGSPRKRKPK